MIFITSVLNNYDKIISEQRENTMILTIDIGNSNLVAVLYDEQKECIITDRIPTVREDVSAYYGEWIKKFLNGYQVEGFIISCVVPKITDEVMELFGQELNCEGLLLTSALVPEFKVSIDNPVELGSDLIATAYGALSKYPAPIAITDMGRANKVSVITKDKVFEGVIISPGIGVSNDAMGLLITHLPKIKLELPKELIGKDTITCMQSGLLYGVICSMEGLVDRIDRELGYSTKRVLTGGYANIVHTEMNMEFEPNLLNDGLLEIYLQKKAIN